jgi:nickel-dependent lactate racemase
MMPTRYDDIWTAAKGCYKMQPAMADGGEVIIYAPHVTEVSEQHPEIYDIGYHSIEYFTKQWDKFKDVPKGVLAHSTHVRGAGDYDPQTGVETNRIKVTLCTQIPEEVCRSGEPRLPAAGRRGRRGVEGRPQRVRPGERRRGAVPPAQEVRP